MTHPTPPILNAKELKALSQRSPDPCVCVLKHCQGWESVSEDRWPTQHMSLQGTLRHPLPEGQTDVSFEEFHPNGTRYESSTAPIALAYFPYNRCDVHACNKCGCAALKYTEYGGYYVDQRARLINPDLIVEST